LFRSHRYLLQNYEWALLGRVYFVEACDLLAARSLPISQYVKWPLNSAKFTQNAPVVGENVMKDRPNDALNTQQ
jgi:hypothetical protein